MTMVGIAETETFINDVWAFYFHDPYNEDWNLPSYKRICTISSVENYWEAHNSIKSQLHNGMFFLMREHVFPTWDDEYNRNGGCLSIKVLKQDVKDFWEHIAIRALGECLMKDPRCFEEINGISTSPKKHFCIIKIWLKSCQYTDKLLLDLPKNYHGEVIFKSNIDNIQNNH